LRPTGKQFQDFDDLCERLRCKPESLKSKFKGYGAEAFIDLTPFQASEIIQKMRDAWDASEAKKAGQRGNGAVPQSIPTLAPVQDGAD
jgi:hypothetical protein